MLRSAYYPRKPLLLGTTGVVALSLLPVVHQPLLPVWLGVAGLWFTLMLADLLLLRGMPRILIERQLHANLAQGTRQPVRLLLLNPGRSRQRVRLHDHHPADFDAHGLPAWVDLDGRERAWLDYTVVPRERGEHGFGDVDVAQGSPFQLWSRLRRVALPQAVRVFPNFGEVAHYTLLASRNKLSAAGVRRRQRRGSGSDFHQLREYQRGDSLRQTEWKATGRYRKLISREYQDEQNQQLLFLLDCGQRMRHRDAAGSHLDAALNAMLLAAHVACKQGDAVGYMSFAGTERYQPPRKGTATVPALLRSVYDLQSSTRAADYLRLVDRFLALQLRRALVVLITNTRDGDQDDLLAGVRLLQRKHLVIVADLRESRLDQALEDPVTGHLQAMRFHTAQQLRRSRADMHEALRHQGVIVLDLLPAQLPLALINEYFEVKRAARL